MDFGDCDRECLRLAIQTVLHNNRNRIHLFMDSEKNMAFIREMSEEIIRRAQKYKHIAGSNVSDYDH
jgi:hypothetical protein